MPDWWENLPPKTWAEAEAKYQTWAALEDKPWVLLERGYQVLYPQILSIETGLAILGQPYTVKVTVQEVLGPEDGGDPIGTGTPFSGTVSLTFDGVDYELVYNEASGTFDGVIQSPGLEAWSPTAYTFEGLVVAVNAAGASTYNYSIVIHKPNPTFLTASVPDCYTGEAITISAKVLFTTIPRSAEAEALVFPGAVTASILGTDYPLTHISGQLFSGPAVAPDVTSWHQDGHVYTGTVTASMTGGSSSTGISFRVREDIPPSVAPVAPAQDVFICNDCSPQFRWSVSDSDSGLSAATVSVDGKAHRYPAQIHHGEACWQMPVVSEGIHTVTVYVVDNDGNETTHSRQISGFTLVDDRTEEDVIIAKRLAADLARDRTPEALAAFLAPSKGAYNTVDVNRVETAVDYLCKRFALHNVPLDLNTKTDWAVTDVPTVTDLARYLGNVNCISDAYSALHGKWKDYYNAFPAALDAPGSETEMTYIMANKIETVLRWAEKINAWADTLAWYNNTHGATWSGIEQKYPTWGTAEGKTWWDLQYTPVIEADLVLPWDVREVT